MIPNDKHIVKSLFLKYINYNKWLTWLGFDVCNCTGKYGSKRSLKKTADACLGDLTEVDQDL
jgi:hypothetical protein